MKRQKTIEDNQEAPPKRGAKTGKKFKLNLEGDKLRRKHYIGTEWTKEFGSVRLYRFGTVKESQHFLDVVGGAPISLGLKGYVVAVSIEAKTKKKFKHVVQLEGQTYERYEEGKRFKRTYKGNDLVKILTRVAEVHSYALDDDYEEGVPWTAELILKEIEERNCDGCDYIVKLTVDGEVKIEMEDSKVEEDEEVVE